MLKKPNPLIYENKDNILLDFTITPFCGFYSNCYIL